jgi:hypothetical protein
MGVEAHVRHQSSTFAAQDLVAQDCRMNSIPVLLRFPAWPQAQVLDNGCAASSWPCPQTLVYLRLSLQAMKFQLHGDTVDSFLSVVLAA